MLVCLLLKNVCFRSVNRFKLWGMETSRRAKGLDLSLQYGARSRNVGLTILFISELISLYRLLIFFSLSIASFCSVRSSFPRKNTTPTSILPSFPRPSSSWTLTTTSTAMEKFRLILTLYLRLTKCLTFSYLFLPNHLFSVFECNLNLT